MDQPEKLRSGAVSAEPPVYYAEALDLCADTLMALKPDDLEARAPKIMAIMRNAAHALRQLAALRDESRETPAGKCECGAWLTMCVGCAVADYQAQFPDCHTCCPVNPTRDATRTASDS